MVTHLVGKTLPLGARYGLRQESLQPPQSACLGSFLRAHLSFRPFISDHPTPKRCQELTPLSSLGFESRLPHVETWVSLPLL